ncbi:MAG: STAS domain-containing protein [Gammaproteobacteria bacterium]|nr:MAG: STAS domain-containing protein [Gammaproteobacteria bacterium]TDJ34045.1 MAG: STAS domain-containing protein [Gammaproteobacteria bacterium]
MSEAADLDSTPGQESGAGSVGGLIRTKIGIMTHLAPRASHLGEAEAAEIRGAAKKCFDRGETHLVLDLAAVAVLDSVVLEQLADIQDAAMRLGGWLKLAHAHSLVQDIIRITGFTDYVTLMDTTSSDLGPTDVPDTQSTSRRLGDILLAKGLVTEKQIAEAIEIQQKTSRRLGQIIIEKGWVPEPEVLKALGVQLDVPFVHLRPGIYDPAIAKLLNKSTARRLRVLPLQRVRGTVSLATVDPQAVPAFDEVAKSIDCQIQPVLASQEDINEAINEAYGETTYSIEFIGDVDDDFEVIENLASDDYAAIDEMAEGSPVINMVNALVQRAVRDGASDIHIEPARNKARVRFRVDGVLYEVTTLRPDVIPAVVSRLKVMANLDIAERRLPQDGRIQVHTQGRAVDLRFSSMPGLYGEKVVLRVLDKNQALLDVEKLGMSEGNLSSYRSLLEHSHGLILVTGPTGSGKTTTLYAALNYLNSIEKNIVTIEDPVEYQLDIINQNEVRDNIGLSFSKILKHTLRQDPDIVMVGEIRDRETAQIAVQAALTGHLVLSTLHTNHAIGAVSRIIDMGVEPYLLSSGLIGVLAQRLVRATCTACKTTFTASPEIVERYGWQDEGRVQLTRGRGCQECYDSGYKGRFGVHEILDADEKLQRLITTNPARDDLTRYLRERKFRSMFDDGLDHVRQGKTTIEEISRVLTS